jgi:two-component sensor histidine kinase
MTIDDYIRTLVASLREGYGSSVTVECTLASIAVAPDHALPLGLIINEVVSNAFKHAFPNQRPGRISISLDVATPGRAHLRIADDGVGFTPGGRTGMGSRLIAGLAQQLEGHFSFRTENGTVFELEFAIPEAGTDPASAREAA